MNDDLAGKSLEELKAIAFADICDYVDFSGPLPRLKRDIPKEKMAAVRSIRRSNKGEEIILYDKVRALQLLGDFLGLWDEFNAAIAALRKYGVELCQDDLGKWQVRNTVNHDAN